MLPFLTNSTTGPEAEPANPSVCPPITAWFAGPAPWKGTWVTGALATLSKKETKVRCEPVPAPALPKVLPPAACAAFKKSARLRACEGWTAKKLWRLYCDADGH
ncbi:hypothetical protein GMDG_08972 [Pseudogymnoascus destructans 20631-21]|uniref:Uncharacterized protein n=1 Tax=Pseudogymnoascus destructans (strain ATCC MYA-4855 / 20631-21) TaxID=658429 RepID=L8FT13_PSED2|nr:hypothetical protein GMDG_08972 [Pseudogymnoascus destructans 20631-21]